MGRIAILDRFEYEYEYEYEYRPLRRTEYDWVRHECKIATSSPLAAG